ncbi:MAG: hypothetical protein A4E45_01299 [Methanosaeta sp. PtaB.Bin039]|nr:MAG: hypothetical protein A4E45_01299 [Methanosaeta sp. PtaB.Bin039]OPY44586.1 MAG: hypothetical protein A4E47_01438 [Methanosaeta sp. PtaU1.Bin028]
MGGSPGPADSQIEAWEKRWGLSEKKDNLASASEEPAKAASGQTVGGISGPRDIISPH